MPKNTARLGIMLPVDLFKKLGALADKKGVSMSFIVRQSLLKYMKDIDELVEDNEEV